MSSADSTLASARLGDPVALDALLRRHYPQILTLCTRLCGNPTDAADATQEALIAVVRGLPRFDGRSAFSTWVYRVATNACLDELRRRRRRPIPAERIEATSTSTADPDDRMDIEAALRTLPIEFRAAVVLRDLCGLDYEEIAEVLAVAPGTVRSRIARGRVALARRLGNQMGFPDVEGMTP